MVQASLCLWVLVDVLVSENWGERVVGSVSSLGVLISFERLEDVGVLGAEDVLGELPELVVGGVAVLVEALLSGLLFVDELILEVSDVMEEGFFLFEFVFEEFDVEVAVDEVLLVPFFVEEGFLEFDDVDFLKIE